MTNSGVAAEDDQLAAVRRVPDSRRAIVACRGNEPAVGAEGHCVDQPRVPAECPDLDALLRIPELDGLIVAGRGE